MFRRSSLPVSRPVASPSSACLSPDLFAARLCGKTARQSASRPNTAVRRPKVAKHRKISTYAKCVCNSSRITTSIFLALKSLWNQHLQKNREGDLGFLAGRLHADQQPMIGIVERQKGVGITPLLPYNKER